MLTILKPTARLLARGMTLACLVVLQACTPPGPRALLDGERLLKQGRWNDAIRRLRTAVEFLPGNAQAWNHLGLAYHRGNKPTEASEAYQQALRLDPGLASAHHNLGCLWLELGNPQRAVESLEAYLRVQSRDVEAWRRLGQAHLRIRQWSRAESSFKVCLQLAPDDPVALNGLGVAHQNSRRYREAWEAFSAALRRDPGFAPAWLNLAVAAHQADARPEAVQAYRQYARLRPDAARAMGVIGTVESIEASLRAQHSAPGPSAAPGAGTGPGTAGPPATAREFAPALVPQSVATPSAPQEVGGGARAPVNFEPRRDPVVAAPADPVRGLESTGAARGLRTAASAEGGSSSGSPGVPSGPPPNVPVPAPGRVQSPEGTPVAASPSPATPTRDGVQDGFAARGAASSRQPVPEPARPAGETRESWSAVPSADVTDRVEPSPAAVATATPEAGMPLPRPLVRPVAEQRRAEGGDRRGFWSRANPANWFGREGDSGRDADESGATPEVPSPAIPEGAPVLTGPTIRVVPPTPAVRETAMARPEPAAAPGVRAVKRYRYLNPASPPPGNRAAATPVFAEGVLEHRRGRLDAALERYERALALDPAFFEAHQNLAAAHLQREDFPKALAASETALVLRPGAHQARLNFALGLDQAGFPADAAAEAERIVDARPDDVAAHLLLGNLYAQQLGDAGRARTHYRRVIELEPDHAQSVAIRRWLAGLP